MTGPIARGTIRTTIVLGLRLIVQAGTLLIVARMLGPRQFGAFAGVAALAVILGTLSTFGTHLVLLGEVSKQPALREQVLRYALPTTLLCGSLLFGIFLAICLTVYRTQGVAVPVLLAIGATETIVQPLYLMPIMVQQAVGRPARSRLLQILPLSMRLATAVAVLLMASADPLTAYSFGYLAASIIATGIVIATPFGRWPHPRTWRWPKPTEVRESVGYGALNITATAPSELDKTLATTLLPLAAAGVYAASARVVAAATLPVTAMMAAALPRLFREGQNPTQGTHNLLRWIFGATFAYGIALAGMLWLAAPFFGYIFGAKYRDIDEFIRWLSIAIPGISLRLSISGILMAIGKPWARVTLETLGMAILLTASIILAKSIGPFGMPIALGCSEWGMTVIGTLLVLNSTQLNTPRKMANEDQ